jgi:hypothetical protein
VILRLRDILNRHVLQHNVPLESSKRILVACETCRRRKIKCDLESPCSVCVLNKSRCVRRSSSTQAVGQMAAQLQQPEHGLDEDVDEGGELEEWLGAPEEGDEDDFADHFDDDGMADDGVEIGRGSFGPTQSAYHEKSSLAPAQPQEQAEEMQTGVTILRSARSVATSTVAESVAVSGEKFSNNMVDFPDWLTGISGISDFTFMENNRQGLSSNTSNQPEPSSQAAQLSELEAFFNKEWPIVHFKTLDLKVAHPALVESISSLSMWVKNEEGQQSLSHQAVNEIITSELLLSEPVSL